MSMQEKLEAKAKETRRLIEETQRFRAVAQSPVKDILLAIYTEIRDYYTASLHQLDENNPDVLSREYGKLRACYNLVNRFIISLENTDARQEELEKKLLSIHDDLDKLAQDAKRREKNKF